MAAEQHPPSSNPWLAHYALFLLTLTYVFNYVDRQIMAVVLEPVKQEFGASDTQMGLLTGLTFALFYATLGIPVARLADRYSRRNILALSCLVWSGMTALCGTASSYGQLALARIGVGVGEAGGTPPSLSMISDLYPRRYRSLATGVFSIGPQLGALVGLAFGAWVAQEYGWRMAFVAVGLPGVLIAALLYFTVPEPMRGRYDPPSATPAGSESLVDALRRIWAFRTFRLIAGAVGFSAFAGYGIGMWNVPFLIRSHDLTLAEAGVLVGTIGAVGSVLGGVFSGVLCDRLSARDSRWQVRVPMLGNLLALPFGLAYFLWPTGSLGEIGGITVPQAMLFSVGFSFFGSWWAAPSYTAINNLVPPETRALAMALLLLFFNLIGMGLGPLGVGIFSDLLAGALGAESLRWALVTGMACTVGAVVFGALAINTYPRELRTE